MTNLGVNLPSGPTDVMKHPEPLRKSTAATFNDERFLQLLIANACDYAGQQLSSENTPVNTIGLWEADGQSKWFPNYVPDRLWNYIYRTISETCRVIHPDRTR